MEQIEKQGGGGSGGTEFISELQRQKSGRGGNGTSYSGGTGGGAARNASGQAGNDYGGAGGNASRASDMGSGAGGGAGNPGGINSTGQWHASPGKDGTGGLLILYANLIKNNGTISSNGMAGGEGEPYYYGVGGCGGGGSGGGSINIFYKQMITPGTITASGGTGGSAWKSGGSGGVGCISKGSIETGTYVNN